MTTEKTINVPEIEKYLEYRDKIKYCVKEHNKVLDPKLKLEFEYVLWELQKPRYDNLSYYEKISIITNLPHIHSWNLLFRAIQKIKPED
jgi:predicted metallopeptidase